MKAEIGHALAGPHPSAATGWCTAAGHLCRRGARASAVGSRACRASVAMATSVLFRHTGEHPPLWLMQWMTLASAIVGALIATACAAMLDRSRWRREQDDRLLSARWVLYSDYLTCLSQARNAFRSLARNRDIDPVERERSACDSFAPCYGMCYQMSIMAASNVFVASEDAAPKGSGGGRCPGGALDGIRTPRSAGLGRLGAQHALCARALPSARTPGRGVSLKIGKAAGAYASGATRLRSRGAAMRTMSSASASARSGRCSRKRWVAMPIMIALNSAARSRASGASMVAAM